MNDEIIRVCYYILWFLFYSFVGWVYESILCSVSQRKLINRGFLNGPYCPIYGAGAIAAILCLSRENNIITIFFLGSLLACTIEYFTSWAMEKLFHARWWDYTNRRFNINGRICLIGAVVFGLFSVILIKIVHPYIIEITYKIPKYVILGITLILSSLIVLDIVITVINIVKFNEKLHKAQIDINNFIKESFEHAEEFKKNIEETMPRAEAVKKVIEESIEESVSYAEKMKQSIEGNIKHNKSNEYIKAFVKRLNYQEKNRLRSFPHFKSTKYNEVLEKIKEHSRKRF